MTADLPARVSAVAGPEPDEGLRAALGRAMALHNPTNHADAVLWNAVATALAAPAAAPVGDEGHGPRCLCFAVVLRAHDGHCCIEDGCSARPPGDEGAARAAVARVRALIAAAPVLTHENGYRVQAVPKADLLAALSAVSGEHH